MHRVVTLVLVMATTLVACADRPPTSEDVVGTYRATLPVGPGPERDVLLQLVAGNVADLQVTFADGRTTTKETGTWSVNPSGDVRVVLARDGFGPVTSDITFRWSRGAVTAVAFDTVRWGARGFSLARAPQ